MGPRCGTRGGGDGARGGTDDDCRCDNVVQAEAVAAVAPAVVGTVGVCGNCWAPRARTRAAAHARSPCSAHSCRAAAQRARTGCRTRAAARQLVASQSDLRAHTHRQHVIVARASSLNEAGRAAHLQRRHQNAADDAPGRPMRGDDRCGRSDPHIGSFGVGWPQPANSRSSGGTPRDTRKERSGGAQYCACAWIACARGNERVSEEQGARRTGVRCLAHPLHARTHVCTSSWRKASSLVGQRTLYRLELRSYSNMPELSKPLRLEVVHPADARPAQRHGGAVELHGGWGPGAQTGLRK